MNREHQISLLKKFIKSDEDTIIINQVNENITILYLYFIRYFADQQGVKINININTETKVIEDDLFGVKQIQVFSITSQNKLSKALDMKDKKIIFTDYKNYKKIGLKFSRINSYQFEKDIGFFIKEELNINNDELIYFCENNPVLLFSETSKYLINNSRYSNDQSLIEEKNHVLDIRKKIFEIKKNNSGIKSLYQNIKKEAEYKKLNFLAY
tara:strand:- start:1053 stop:1685 length:633 start_codon:yes stop_codon:yes gene_type:complete